MTVEIILQTIAIIGALGAGIGFIWKKGVKSGIDQTCIETIEKDVNELKTTIGKKKHNSTDTHNDLYEKIDETNQRCGKIETDISYIKGKIDQALGTKWFSHFIRTKIIIFFMGTIERRLARIEAHLGLNKPDKKKSPRETSKEIFKGNLQEQHIGTKSLEVLKQEADSLIQNFKPSTWTNKEKAEMKEAIGDMIAQINRMGVEDYGNKYLEKLKEMAREVSTWVSKVG